MEINGERHTANFHDAFADSQSILIPELRDLKAKERRRSSDYLPVLAVPRASRTRFSAARRVNFAPVGDLAEPAPDIDTVPMAVRRFDPTPT
jgi:hypothetical protein